MKPLIVIGIIIVPLGIMIGAMMKIQKQRKRYIELATLLGLDFSDRYGVYSPHTATEKDIKVPLLSAFSELMNETWRIHGKYREKEVLIRTINQEESIFYMFVKFPELLPIDFIIKKYYNKKKEGFLSNFPELDEMSYTKTTHPEELSNILANQTIRECIIDFFKPYWTSYNISISITSEGIEFWDELYTLKNEGIKNEIDKMIQLSELLMMEFTKQ